MDEAYDIVYLMCQEGKLDFNVVAKLKEHLALCYEYAIGSKLHYNF